MRDWQRGWYTAQEWYEQIARGDRSLKDPSLLDEKDARRSLKPEGAVSA